MLGPETTFNSEINSTSDISVYNHPYEYLDGGVLKIEWTFQVESREWGIKSLGIHVKRVHGELEFEEYDNEDDDYPVEKTLEIDAKSTETEWEIKTEIQVEDPFTSDIYPNDIEINWEKKEITVIF